MLNYLWGKKGPTLALWITVIAAIGLIAAYNYMPKPPQSFRGVPYGISSEELGIILGRKYGTAPQQEETAYLCITKRRAGSERLYFETPLPSKRFLGVRVECDSIGFEEAVSELILKYGKPAITEQDSKAGNAWWTWDGDTSNARYRIHVTGDNLSHKITYRNGAMGWE